MKKRLTIALVAHDNRKADLVEWAVFNSDELSKHHLVCTGTTGTLVKEAFEKKGVTADITCMHSGPLGGDAEIAALVVQHKINLAIFLIDDLNPQHTDVAASVSRTQCAYCLQPVQCRPDDYQYVVG